MGKTKKRKEQLTERTKNETLQFQVSWGIQTLGIVLTEDVHTRIDNELRILQNLGLADNLMFHPSHSTETYQEVLLLIVSVSQQVIHWKRE